MAGSGWKYEINPKRIKDSVRGTGYCRQNPTYKNAVWCAHRPFGLLDEVQHFFDCSIESISGQLVDPRLVAGDEARFTHLPDTV